MRQQQMRREYPQRCITARRRDVKETWPGFIFSHCLFPAFQSDRVAHPHALFIAMAPHSRCLSPGGFMSHGSKITSTPDQPRQSRRIESPSRAMFLTRCFSHWHLAIRPERGNIRLASWRRTFWPVTHILGTTLEAS